MVVIKNTSTTTNHEVYAVSVISSEYSSKRMYQVTRFPNYGVPLSPESMGLPLIIFICMGLHRFLLSSSLAPAHWMRSKRGIVSRSLVGAFTSI